MTEVMKKKGQHVLSTILTLCILNVLTYEFITFLLQRETCGEVFFLTNTEVANLAKYTVYVTAKKEKKRETRKETLSLVSQS